MDTLQRGKNRKVMMIKPVNIFCGILIFLLIILIPDINSAQSENQLRFGFNYHINDQNFNNENSFNITSNIPALSAEYTHCKKNENNFLELLKIKTSLGKRIGNTELNQTTFELGVVRSVGFDFNGIKLFPFSSGGMRRQYFNKGSDYNIEESYIGSRSEFGTLMLFNNVGFELSYCQTNYGDEESILKKMGSSALQFGTIYGTKYLLTHFLSDSKLYPIYRFAAETLLRIVFLKLKFDKIAFPFESETISHENTIKLGTSIGFSL